MKTDNHILGLNEERCDMFDNFLREEGIFKDCKVTLKIIYYE